MNQFSYLTDITVQFELNNINYSTNDFFNFNSVLKTFLKENHTQNITVRLLHNSDVIKEFNLEVTDKEEFVYFKRNVINMLSGDTDVIKNVYKVVCVGKKTETNTYDLTYYNFRTNVEIKSQDINFLPVI